MKKNLFSIIILLSALGTSEVSAQKLLWSASMHNIFDNHEFDQFQGRRSLTVAETHLTPMIGLGLDSCRHRIFAGADVAFGWGSKRFLQKVQPIAYYQFSIPHFNFQIGAFPKKELLGNYPLMLLSDSVMWSRPVMNGIFLQYTYNTKNYANLWLDWTGYEEPLVYESFFVGFSGKFQTGIFYLQNFTYLYHMVINNLANESRETFNPVKENYKTLLSVGLDFAEKTGLDKLRTDIGLSAAMERNRGVAPNYMPLGLLWQTEVEYRGLEFRNSFYYGDPQQKFYSDYGNHLYWGDLMYRTSLYNRTDLMVHFYKSNIINISLDVSLHLLKGQALSCQSLKATFDIDNLSRRHIDKSYSYIWQSWFSK